MIHTPTNAKIFLLVTYFPHVYLCSANVAAGGNLTTKISHPVCIHLTDSYQGGKAKLDGASNPDCTQMHRTKPNEINSIKVFPPNVENNYAQL